MYQHWAVRSEVSQRCGQIARNGYLPTHTPAVKAATLRYQRCPTLGALLLADYCQEQTCPPPCDDAYGDIVAQTQAQLVQALSVHSSRIASHVKRVVVELVDSDKQPLTRMLCDLFWAVVIDLHLSNTLVTAKCASAVPADAESKPPVHSLQGLATGVEIEEVFAAACAPSSDSLDPETFVRLLTRLQLLLNRNVVWALMEDIRLDRNPLSFLPPPRLPSTRFRVQPPPAATLLSDNNTAASFVRPYRTGSLSSATGEASAQQLLGEEQQALDDTQTSQTMLIFGNMDGDSPKISKSEFVRWLRLQKISDRSASSLQSTSCNFSLRASKKFRNVLSPFRFSLAVRDAVELPLISVLSSVLVTWLRSAVSIPEDGPFAGVDGQCALHRHVERLVSKKLLGIAVNGEQAVLDSASHPASARHCVATRDELSAAREGSQARRPVSLHSTARSGRGGTGDNSEHGTFGNIDASSPMESAMLPFTKAVRLGIRHVASTSGVPTQPNAATKQGDDSATRAIASSRYRYASNPSCVYRSFQTLLSVMDEEVAHERVAGEEANIHRASMYIAAQQRLSAAIPTPRHPTDDKPTSGGASPSSASKRQVLPFGAVSLEDMLRDELRPECVRQALENGASSAMASAQSIFHRHNVQPLSTRERLTIVLKQGETSEAAMARPFSARRRTAPVADITSATSQRTIAKHAKRLQQEYDSVRNASEKILEKHSQHYMREYHNVLAPSVATIAGQSPEDAEILRAHLIRVNEQLNRVLRHNRFLYLRPELRLAIVQCATAAGKDVKTMQRMHQRFSREGLVGADSDSDDGNGSCGDELS